MLSTGATRKYLAWGVAYAILGSLAFIVGIAWGPVGVAIAYAVATIAIFVPSLVYATRGTAVQTTEILAAIACPAISSGMAAVALAIKNLLSPLGTPHSIGSLGFDLLLFAACYLGAYAMTNRGRDEMRYFTDYLRIAIGKASTQERPSSLSGPASPNGSLPG